VKQAKLLLLTTGLLLSVLAQNTRPLLAADAIVAQPVSFLSNDTGSFLSNDKGSSSRAATTMLKKLRVACYPVWDECTKDSDCCSGFCRAGRVAAYCDNK
jgi:hypothetical protein